MLIIYFSSVVVFFFFLLLSFIFPLLSYSFSSCFLHCLLFTVFLFFLFFFFFFFFLLLLSLSIYFFFYSIPIAALSLLPVITSLCSSISTNPITRTLRFLTIFIFISTRQASLSYRDVVCLLPSVDTMYILVRNVSIKNLLPLPP